MIFWTLTYGSKHYEHQKCTLLGGGKPNIMQKCECERRKKKKERNYEKEE